MEIKNSEELKKAYPELMNQAMQDAVNQERSRITALRTMDDANNSAVHIIVENAIKTGVAADSIKDVVEEIKKNTPDNVKNNAATQTMENIINDNKKSGVDNIASSGGAPENNDKKEEIMAIDIMAKRMNAKNGRVK